MLTSFERVKFGCVFARAGVKYIEEKFYYQFSASARNVHSFALTANLIQSDQKQIILNLVNGRNLHHKWNGICIAIVVRFHLFHAVYGTVMLLLSPYVFFNCQIRNIDILSNWMPQLDHKCRNVFLIDKLKDKIL